MAIWLFFSAAPTAPKQPRIEYPFYRFLYHPMICGTISGYSDDMFSSLQGSGGKTPEKQTTPSGKDLETSVADNDEIKGAYLLSNFFVKSQRPFS